MSSVCLASTSREDFIGIRIKTPPRWNTSLADDMLMLQNHDAESRRRIGKKKGKKKRTERKECEMQQKDRKQQKERHAGSDMLCMESQCDPEISSNKISDRVPSPRDQQHEELSLDFSWLTKDFHVECVNDLLARDVTEEPCNNVHDECLSQRPVPLTSGSDALKYEPDLQYERSCIEEEIRQKYAELNNILKQLHGRRHNQKRRRKTQTKKAEVNDDIESDQWTPSYVNICPIRRRKRSAQPIRNALLVRTAMRKAWKGMLGSCCGKGCWATWKWVNLKGVMSDYE